MCVDFPIFSCLTKSKSCHTKRNSPPNRAQPPNRAKPNPTDPTTRHPSPTRRRGDRRREGGRTATGGGEFTPDWEGRRWRTPPVEFEMGRFPNRKGCSVNCHQRGLRANHHRWRRAEVNHVGEGQPPPKGEEGRGGANHCHTGRWRGIHF